MRGIASRWARAATPLGRFAPCVGLVGSRQIFVRRGQGMPGLEGGSRSGATPSEPPCQACRKGTDRHAVSFVRMGTRCCAERRNTSWHVSRRCYARSVIAGSLAVPALARAALLRRFRNIHAPGLLAPSAALMLSQSRLNCSAVLSSVDPSSGLAFFRYFCGDGGCFCGDGGSTVRLGSTTGRFRPNFWMHS